LDLKEIKQIIDLMKRSDLTELEIEQEGLKLRICRGQSGHFTASLPGSAESLHLAGSGTPHAQIAPVPAEEGNVEENVVYIKSPMVGTFYRSPAPELPSFVELGHKVSEKSPVCIIEAMKVMNEIQAEVAGTILEILLENGQPVEYGQPLFKVKKG